MPNGDLISVTEIATDLKEKLSNASEQLGNGGEVTFGNTNHSVNGKCCSYFADINGILSSYSRSAVRDAEKITAIDNEIISLDETLKSKM